MIYAYNFKVMYIFLNVNTICIITYNDMLI